MSAGARLPAAPEPMAHWETPSGVTIAGDVWGDAAGPVVVLQHGGGQTRHAWKGTGETLAAAGYRAVALDARGHGDSSWAEDGDYTQDAQVEDLVAVLEQIGGDRPVLVGASMGGGTSLVAVGEGHVDAAALVLVDIAPRLEAEGAAKIGAFMGQGADGFATLDEVADAIAAYQPHRPRPRQLDGLAKNVRLGADGRYHWHWDPAFRARTRDLDERHRRLEACARNLDLPTLLVRGGLSDILTEEGAAGVPHALPGRRVREHPRRRAHGRRRPQRRVRRGRRRLPAAPRPDRRAAPSGRSPVHHLPPGEHRITDVP